MEGINDPARDFTADPIIAYLTAYGSDVLRDAYGDRVPGSGPRWLDENRPGWRTRMCSIEGCGRKHRARGLCGAHYERWRRYGDPLHVWTPPERTAPTQAEIVAEMRRALTELTREAGE